MTTYRNIHGRSIQSVTTDPSESVAEGQVWYNSNSDTFKTVLVNEAFSSASNLPSIAFRRTGFGVQTAGVIAGGSSTSTNRLTVTEEYNGSGFSVGGTLNEGRRLASGAGTQTAGLFYLGAGPSSDTDVSTKNETYDGTSYSEVGDLTTARQGAAGDGSQTAAFAAAGSIAPGPSAAAETWDGSSWTNIPSVNTTRRFVSGNGTPSAAVIFGGETTPTGTPTATRKATEEYNGSSWTTVNSMNTGTATGGSGGTQTALISFAGRAPSVLSGAESYDGTTWSASPATLATARSMVAGLGSGTAALCAGGETGPGAYTAASEEYNKSANVITAGAWASTNNLNTARSSLAGAGTKSAGLMYGGSTPGGTPSNTSEEYDGTSFTEGNNLNTARYTYDGTGTQTAAVTFGGSPAPIKAYTEEYDGTSWTESGDMGTGRYSVAAGGTQTAAFGAGGYSGGNKSNVEHYDGSSWTSATALPSARRAARGSGTLTAGLCMGGYAPPGYFTNTEEYDGSSWSAGGALPTGMSDLQCCGPQTANFIFGFAPGKSVLSHNYDGTAWATAPSLGTGRNSAGPSKAGSQTAALIAGGDSPSSNRIATAEEFTGETSALNVKTLTQS